MDDFIYVPVDIFETIRKLANKYLVVIEYEPVTFDGVNCRPVTANEKFLEEYNTLLKESGLI